MFLNPYHFWFFVLIPYIRFFFSVPPPGYDVKGDASSSHAGPFAAPKRRGTSSSNLNKTTRDPNAPKRNMSAYLLYQNCMREQFKAHNPGMTFGQLAKYTSYMYKCLSMEEKQRWEAHAAQDKARYEAEMTTYGELRARMDVVKFGSVFSSQCYDLSYQPLPPDTTPRETSLRTAG